MSDQRSAEPPPDLIGALDDLTIELGGSEGRQPWVGPGVAAEGDPGIAEPGEVVPVEQRQRRDAGRAPPAPAIVAAHLSGHDEAGRGEAMVAKDRHHLALHAGEPIVERERGGIDPIVEAEQLLDTHDPDLFREQPRHLPVKRIRRHGNRRPRSVERMPGQDGAHVEMPNDWRAGPADRRRRP